MFGIIEEMFMGLLNSLVNTSNYPECVSLSNKKCITQPTLIILLFYYFEYSQDLYYYPFLAKLNGCIGSCNTVIDLSNKVYVPNKTEDLNLSVFNMITGINQSKTLTKYVSCECKCRFDGRKCNSDPWWNNDKCQYECKKR